MAFIQIIDLRTSRYDEVAALGAEWQAAAGSDSTARRRVLVQDRDTPGRYLNIVFFDSYESAMANSANPVTAEFAAKMATLLDGEPTYLNLDVLEDVTL